eukprot:7837025-Alexandrium_andersonii.AAC.1
MRWASTSTARWISLAASMRSSRPSRPKSQRSPRAPQAGSPAMRMPLPLVVYPAPPSPDERGPGGTR